LVSHFNPRLQDFARTFAAWLADHPEVSVRTTQDVLFYFFSVLLMPLSIFAMGMALPTFITRDLASNAIIIYSSKAVSRGDYLLGKFAGAFGLLTLTWLGPICTAWLMGNLLAPDWRFFWHARIALAHAMVYGLTTMAFLSLLALGISAISAKERSTVALWYTWWILARAIVPIASHTRPWLRHVSFSFNLDQVALAVFRLGDDLRIAQDNVPIFGGLINLPPDRIEALSAPAFRGAAIALLVIAAAAAVVVHKRVKPE